MLMVILARIVSGHFITLSWLECQNVSNSVSVACNVLHIKQNCVFFLFQLANHQFKVFAKHTFSVNLSFAYEIYNLHDLIPFSAHFKTVARFTFLRSICIYLEMISWEQANQDNIYTYQSSTHVDEQCVVWYVSKNGLFIFKLNGMFNMLSLLPMLISLNAQRTLNSKITIRCVLLFILMNIYSCFMDSI